MGRVEVVNIRPYLPALFSTVALAMAMVECHNAEIFAASDAAAMTAIVNLHRSVDALTLANEDLRQRIEDQADQLGEQNDQLIDINARLLSCGCAVEESDFGDIAVDHKRVCEGEP